MKLQTGFFQDPQAVKALPAAGTFADRKPLIRALNHVHQPLKTVGRARR